MDYDEENVLTRYVRDHFTRFLTAFERRVGISILGRAKADLADSPQLAKLLLKKWGEAGDVEIEAALADGEEAYRRRVRDRLMFEHAAEIVVNRCPKCKCIVRTPLARQCFWCGFDWHNLQEPQMWTHHSEPLNIGRTIKISIDLDSTPISYAQTLRRWQCDAEFRSLFISLLADSPFTAFRWETPPITAETVHRPFEFVLLDCPNLARKPDADAFAEHFRSPGKDDVIEFGNLGKDAIMVVPCPTGSPSAYGHLAAFVREAPQQQVHSLWKLVGATMQRRLGAKPVWLSTAGAGVSWLHVRLDDRPKYYGYSPYREGA